MAPPTKYKPEYCKVVIEKMSDGCSIIEVAAACGVCTDSIYEYEKKFPEMADALKKGRELCEAWWQRQGRENLKNKDFSAVLWYMNMKNRFGWRDSRDEAKPDSGLEGAKISIKILPKGNGKKERG